jgi:acetyl-CoA carboxylase biotin carboxyl carrier protein
MAFDLEDLKKIIAVAKESGLTEIEVSEGDCTYRCVLQPKSTVTTQVIEAIDQQTVVNEPKQPEVKPSSPKNNIVSPMVGTVYLAPAPDADPYVIEGKHIKKGEVICLIEAMKMFNKVKAERDGVIRSVHIKDGSSVEFEQVLFEFDEA